jgi:hypothetical protein
MKLAIISFQHGIITEITLCYKQIVYILRKFETTM